MTVKAHTRREFLRKRGRARRDGAVRRVRFCDSRDSCAGRGSCKVNSIRFRGARRRARHRHGLSPGDCRELRHHCSRRRNEMAGHASRAQPVRLREGRRAGGFCPAAQHRDSRPHARLVWRHAGLDQRDREPRRGRSGTGRPYRDRGVALSRRHSLLGRRQRAADRLAGGRQFAAAVDLDQAAWTGLHPDRAARPPRRSIRERGWC